MFMEQIKDALHDDDWFDANVVDFNMLGKHIGKMCEDKKVVVLIDEVDKASNNVIFSYFLGMLRKKFLLRNEGEDITFHSVILAGVTNIKNIKYQMVQKGMLVLGENEGSHNSPWNIAADFKVDMSFVPKDIATMLQQYETDYNTGMDITLLAEEIYSYTSGYPFLVSRMCQCIDEELQKDWTLDGIQRAVKIILEEANTLFDDMCKNLENDSELREFVYNVLIKGEAIPFTIDDRYINFGFMFGYFKNENGRVAIANKIFAIRMTNYFILRTLRSKQRVDGIPLSDVIKGDKFDMQRCLEKFKQHYEELCYLKEDAKFVERHGRMLFLSYLKPLINGVGFYHIESGLTDLRRMDIVVDYGREQFIIFNRRLL